MREQFLKPDNNLVVISGMICSDPVESEHRMTKVFGFNIMVDRSNNNGKDVFLICTDNVDDAKKILIGKMITVTGKVKSFMVDGKKKTYIKARSIANINNADTSNCNRAMIEGKIINKPFFSEKDGRKKCSFMVNIQDTCNRQNRIPVVAWGNMAERLRTFNIGDKIGISGKMQVRFFKKNDEEMCETYIYPSKLII